MSSKYHLDFYLMTFCCFINKRWFLENLVNAYPQYNIQSQKDDLRKTILYQRRSLIDTLKRSFEINLLAVLLGFILVILKQLHLSFFHNKIFGIISILSFSIATLAQLGIGELTGPGDLPFEQLDKIILQTMYFVGALCGTISCLSF